MDLKDLYQELILDHGKNPRNLGKFENFNKDAKGHNPLCGDKVHVYLKLDENKKISDIKFEGHGCAISMASASIMTELMKNKEEVEVKELIDDFLKMIKDSPELKSKIISDDDKIKLMSLSGVKKYPMRVKCATLPWHTLVSALTSVIDDHTDLAVRAVLLLVTPVLALPSLGVAPQHLPNTVLNISNQIGTSWSNQVYLGNNAISPGNSLNFFKCRFCRASRNHQ